MRLPYAVSELAGQSDLLMGRVTLPRSTAAFETQLGARRKDAGGRILAKQSVRPPFETRSGQYSHRHHIELCRYWRLRSPATNLMWSIPVTWVTVYSDDIGNTLEPKGLLIGSTRQPSSSK